MKFYADEYTVTGDYEMTIRRRLSMLAEHLPKRMAVHPIIITTFGIKPGRHNGIFVNSLTLDALFRR